MSWYVSPEVYRRYGEVILEYTNAKQRYEQGRVVRGLSDAEIAEKLDITPDEATEVRCVAELDLVESGRWFDADAWKEDRFNRVQRPS